LAPWIVLVATVVAAGTLAQQPPAPTTPDSKVPDLEAVQRLLKTRKEYQASLEQLRLLYLKYGDTERAKWAEEELRQYHRVPHNAFRIDLDVPPAAIGQHIGLRNEPAANKLYTWAMSVKDKGWGQDYSDNQRRAEILLQDIVERYPHSDKVSDVAFMLGDIYESKAYKQYRRAAAWYERCVQWNPKTHYEARLRAARLYDHEVKDRQRAIDLYREITTHETDQKRIQEATKRLNELSVPTR